MNGKQLRLKEPILTIDSRLLAARTRCASAVHTYGCQLCLFILDWSVRQSIWRGDARILAHAREHVYCKDTQGERSRCKVTFHCGSYSLSAAFGVHRFKDKRLLLKVPVSPSHRGSASGHR